MRLNAFSAALFAGVSAMALASSASSEEVSIGRGENAGKTITYTHIVRDWDVAARWDGLGTFEGAVPVPAGTPVVVILQEPKNGAILAARRLR